MPEAVRFDGAAPTAPVSAGGVTGYAGDLDQTGEMSWHGDRVKRFLDVILAIAGLSVSSPLWVLIALAIKLEDRGPVLYRQDRVGMHGKVFQVLKFRSMVVDAEEVLGPVQVSPQDPRVTRIGGILRATALDELPQLWSILQGHMSFVGPRALRPGEIEISGDGDCVPLEAIAGYAERHAVRPGLTGLAQVYAPRDIPRQQKFRYDVLYLRRRTLWLDFRLIAVSLWISLRGCWGRQERRY